MRRGSSSASRSSSSGSGGNSSRSRSKGSTLSGVGFSKERISQYRKQGLSDERISKLWQDTLKMRALMKKRKEQGVSDLEAGVSQSWKNAQARRDRAFDKRFNDEWNRYRSAADIGIVGKDCATVVNLRPQRCAGGGISSVKGWYY